YRRRLPQETAQVVYSLGTIYERQENWRQVVKHYEDFLKKYRRQALPQQVVRANVQIGKAYWQQNDKRKAQRYFETAVRAYSGGAVEAINSAVPEGQARELAIYEAKEGASEALFFLAEYKYAEF